MQWQEIVEFLGGATVFGFVIAYLGKTAIDAYVTGRVEAYKGDLQRLTTEHSVRFQSLHSERAEVIKDFYSHLAQLDRALTSTLAPFQSSAEAPLEEKVQALEKYFTGTNEYFLPRRIFFDEATCLLVDKILGLAKGIFFDITTYKIDPTHPSYKDYPSDLLERYQYWQKARTAHESDFTSLKRKLEDEFRKLLGIGA
jgi:hypothetical protein